MLLLLISCLIALALAAWAVAAGNRLVRFVALLTASACFCYFGYGLGRGLERVRCYDSYIYWFSEYSAHLHTLVAENKFGELTNDIIVFDTKFTSHKDTQTLQDAMYDILKIGPYFQAGTNAAAVSQNTNSNANRHTTP